MQRIVPEPKEFDEQAPVDERASLESRASRLSSSSKPSKDCRKIHSLSQAVQALSHSEDSFNPGSPSFIPKYSSNGERLTKRSTQKMITDAVMAQTQVRDESELYSVAIIMSAILVAACCGVGAFTLHLAVLFAGCLGGVNGCDKSVLLDVLEPLGIDKSVYFIFSSGLSGFACSCIIYSPWHNRVARNCSGGGSAGTKIAVSAGQQVSGWVVVLRIVLAGVYLGGGNTLGTEGPVVHLGTALATYLTWLSGTTRRKIVSLFGVIGASAGISAGFNVLITGFIYTTEELTRTISRRLVLILTVAAAAAMLVKNSLELLLEHWFHIEHVSLVPPWDTLAELTSKEFFQCLCLCIPIGILNGIAGWCLTRLAWAVRHFLNPGKEASRLRQVLLPRLSHLAVIGVITGCFGAIAYKVTGVNGVWGTTIGAIPEAIVKGVTWKEALLLFLMKFLSFALATAGGGPGGMLVPSLVAGGFLGLSLGLLVGGSDAFCSASAVVGMGSLFASVMHLPVSGVIIIFELTETKSVLLPVVIANFIASNVAYRLPHGEHSFAHLMLLHDPVWEKLGKQDFIETDAHETSAHTSVGFGQIHKFQTSALKEFFKSDVQRTREAFTAWRSAVEELRQQRGCGLQKAMLSRQSSKEVGTFSRNEPNIYEICEQIMTASSDMVCICTAWRSWLLVHGKLKDPIDLYKMCSAVTGGSFVNSFSDSGNSEPENTCPGGVTDKISEPMSPFSQLSSQLGLARSAQQAQSSATAFRAARNILILARSREAVIPAASQIASNDESAIYLS